MKIKLSNPNTNRRFICIGDLIADYYYNANGTLQKVDGGCSKFNDICNLARFGNNTTVFSTCSTTNIGEMLISGLKSSHVDTSNINRIGTSSNIYHLLYDSGGNFKSQKTCPICNKKTWYETSNTHSIEYSSKIKSTDIILFDNLRDEDLSIINNYNNEKILDLGQYKLLKSLSKSELSKALYKKFEIVQLNERVEEYLINRFNLENILELYMLISPSLLIVTRGKNGADIIYDSHYYKKFLLHDTHESDTTGAGDVFLSVFTHQYFSYAKKTSKNFIDDTFDIATQYTSQVVCSQGARGHLYNGYTPYKIPGKCLCEDFIFNEIPKNVT